MSTQYARAPHVGGAPRGPTAPNAALLIDFDNVTMGMRSDLSKDLRKLLQSDVIRGKVTVQRAYADWRRYPQYIVPLSENSIDLIFAPAYGSSKKNATDIRMAIDGMELIFTRPEIGTYILLTGDSDFSSLVLKLKEYGKYVIGVGIQESSSDILVQNCDEYYSYTNLAGLTKTTETDVKSMDPWVLVEKAVKKMRDRDDVMRSDRLKQVMIEIDSSFDEGGYGFSKFSKFVTEAASRGLISLKKMSNGQYEVSPGGSASSSRRKDRGEEQRGRRSRRDRKSGGDRDDSPRSEPDRKETSQARSGSQEEAGGDGVDAAFDLLRRSLQELKDDGRHPVRDSDVKRKMLEIQQDFDEGTLGFSKFSHFLRQAHDQEVVDLSKRDGGSYDVSLPGSGSSGQESKDRGADTPSRGPSDRDETPDVSGTDSEASSEEDDQLVVEFTPDDVGADGTAGRRLGPRGGTTRRRSDADAPPPILEGQGRPASGSSGDDSGGEGTPNDLSAVELGTLNLPGDTDKMVRYLTNYRGVGEKTAQQVVDRFGTDTFRTLHENPEAVKQAVPPSRAERLLSGWEADLRRRVSDDGGDEGRKGGRSRRGGRGRRGGRSNRGGDRTDG